MKKLIGIVLTLCILSALVVPVYATGNDYPYIDTNPSIITPDSFEEMFSDEEIDRVSYDYEMIVPEGNQKALIILQMEIKVGKNTYLSSASGNVRSHSLPSGDVLWQGPISGSITVDNEELKVTAGFLKLESTGEVMVSITIQNGAEIVAFSFGSNMVRGEVLDFFMEKAAASQQHSQQPELSVDQNLRPSVINSQNNESSLLSFPDLTVNPGIFDGGGGGGTTPNPNLGENGEWVYQGTIPENTPETSYCAAETKVYYDITSGNLIVATKPLVSQVSVYAETLGPITSVILDSFETKVEILSITGPDCAAICAYSVPNRDLYGFSFLGYEATYLYAFISDVARYFSIPSTVKTKLETEIFGKVVVNYDMFKTNIKVDLSILASVSANELERINPGLPIIFRLQRGTESTYTGNTPYKVTSKVTYCVLITSNTTDVPAVLPLFITESYERNFTIDLVN